MENQGQFQWYAGKVGQQMEERAAILLPVDAGGVRCIMQLDTAAASSMLYRPMLSDETVKRLDAGELRVTGGSGRYTALPGTAAARIDFGSVRADHCAESHPGTLIGTLGNDLFRNAALELNLKSATFDVLVAPDINKVGEETGSLAFDPAFPGLPVVTLQDASGKKRRMLVDTGSAPIVAVLYHLEDWRKVTGQQDLSKLASMEVVRWGKPARCYQAPAQIALSTGIIQVGRGDDIFYCDFMSDAVRDDNALSGMLGMKPFGTSTVVFDYLSNRLRVRPSD